MHNKPKKYIICGRPVSKKNSHRVRWKWTHKGRKTFVANSRRYLAWAEDAVTQLQIQRGGAPSIVQKVHADVVVYLAKGQRLDGDNALGGPFDALEAAGIISNDNQIISHTFVKQRDWEEPRVEITLQPFKVSHG